MINPRTTRLLRVANLRQFRDTLTSLACDDNPLAARDRLVVVPTHAAAVHLRRAIEDRLLLGRPVVVLPEFVIRDDLALRLADRIPHRPPLLTGPEREVLLARACREVSAAGVRPPFRLRPALVAEILGFYDALRRQQRDVGTFERLIVGALAPNAEFDRGAERLVRQTRFLVAAFLEFERLCAATGALDEHSLRQMLLDVPATWPWKHAIVAVRDVAASRHGLWTCDFDLLARLPGLERLDVILTQHALAAGLHERVDRELPGLEEVRIDHYAADDSPHEPAVSKTGSIQIVRDREEEVMGFARRIKRRAREDNPPPLNRVALVVRRPLPYVYLAREVLRSAGVPCQMFDALPLAAEPYAAALDLVFAFVTSNFSRAAIVALLQSPHFRFSSGRLKPAPTTETSTTRSARSVASFDRAASEAGYLGGEGVLEALVAGWQNDDRSERLRAARTGSVALRLARELTDLKSPRPPAFHLDVLLGFLNRYDVLPGPDDPLRARQVRARAAILSTLGSLRDAFARHDESPGDFADLAQTIRRWIEGQTFWPRTGESGVHVVDAESAAFGDFEDVQLAGLVDGEWPQRPRRNIFYSFSLLQQLGWPAEGDRLEGERALVRDLVHLPSRRLAASAFLLEDDAIVTRSPFGEELEGAELIEDEPVPSTRIFDYEALTLDPLRLDVLPESVATWARLRRDSIASRRRRQRGTTAAPGARAYSLTALERYQDCPFKFFASEVLRLEEPPDDQATLTPRTQGRFIHDVFQRFFETWDRQGGGAITPECLDTARAQFVDVAEALLEPLPEADAALQRARLFGSAAAVGIVDVVLGLEASRSEPVVERWLEYRLDGVFALGGTGCRRVSLRGVADRVDLLAGRRLRVIDYKSGYPPPIKRALQVPVYALCASERLQERDGEPWVVDEAAYVAFSGKRTLVPVIKSGAPDAAAILASARDRVFDALDAIGHGQFPPRPFDPAICRYCAFASVCRKDYVGDE